MGDLSQYVIQDGITKWNIDQKELSQTFRCVILYRVHSLLKNIQGTITYAKNM